MKNKVYFLRKNGNKWVLNHEFFINYLFSSFAKAFSFDQIFFLSITNICFDFGLHSLRSREVALNLRETHILCLKTFGSLIMNGVLSARRCPLHNTTLNPLHSTLLHLFLLFNCMLRMIKNWSKLVYPWLVHV